MGKASCGSQFKSVDANWAWSPYLGRWSPDYGHPALPSLIQVSTDDVPEGEGFDYWRHIACYDWDPHPPEDAAAFKAHGMGIVDSETEFYRFNISSIEGFRTRAARISDGHDHIVVGLVLDGLRQAEAEGDRIISSDRGRAFVHDAAATSRVAWTHGAGLHLMLRRRDLHVAFGGHQLPPSLLTAMFENSPMFNLWRQQMILFGRHASGLPAVSRSFALGQLHALTRFIIGQCRTNPLRAAALALIEAYLSEPRLSPEWLAGRLGCSRATLYRAFGSDPGGIAALISDRRFAEAKRRLLERPDLPIADVALGCGILDTVNFSRGFRRRFGMKPSDLREDHRAR
ncbi:MAG: helix-turn-helix domain-containing protein [Sandaracinobacter sp.]